MSILQKGLKWLSVVTAVWMFFVLLGGALVTKTESGRGCGDDWPLCNGKFVPAYTVESILEYSHRVVSGVAGLLIVSLFALVWWKWRQRKDMLLYVGGASFLRCCRLFWARWRSGGNNPPPLWRFISDSP